jgi:hypothetical protein
MKIMNGKLHQKSLSRVSQTNLATVIEMLIPVVLGIAAIVAHARYRSHINLPGHHGLEFMALLLISFSSSKIKWSSYFFSLGVAAFVYVPFLGFKSPLVAMVYILPGVVFGLLSSLAVIKKYRIIFLAVFGGLAYASIPIFRLILWLTTGITHKSVMISPVSTITFFFMFGIAGSLLGLGAYHLFKKIAK